MECIECKKQKDSSEAVIFFTVGTSSLPVHLSCIKKVIIERYLATKYSQG